MKIDPTYSKAWGRLGLAFLSNNQNEEAFEAYTKAIQLEPNNDGYKQNLKIVEEKLKASRPQGGIGVGVAQRDTASNINYFLSFLTFRTWGLAIWVDL